MGGAVAIPIAPPRTRSKPMGFASAQPILQAAGSLCPRAEAVMIWISILAALMYCTVTMAAAADDLYRARSP